MKLDAIRKEISSLQNIKIISFDCFDTLLHRDCNSEVVLYEWSKLLSDYLDGVYSPEKIYNTRKKIEIDKKKQQGVEEMEYNALIEKLLRELNVTTNIDQLIDYSKKIEVATEIRHINSDEEVKKLVFELKNKGIRLIVISDFYFGSEMLSQILNKIGYDNCFEYLYVSSDVNARKSTGSLYDIVLSRELIQPHEMVMIGDNITSDKIVPSERGICSFQLTTNESVQLTYTKNDIKNEFKRLCAQNTLDGYTPSLLLWAERLLHYVKVYNIKDLLFCSREGQFLKKVFDFYVKKSGQDVNTHYVYVSRASTGIAGLKSLTHEKFEKLLNGKDCSILGLLSKLGANQELIDKITLQCHGIDQNTLVARNGAVEVKVLEKLKRSEAFELFYNNIRSENINLLRAYFNQMGLDFTEQGLNLVDVGWIGTIQDNIRNVIPDEITVRGFYLGLIEEHKHNRIVVHSENNEKVSILMHKSGNECSYGYWLMAKDRTFFEFLLSANHGPTVCYDKDINGVIFPVVNGDTDQVKIYDVVAQYQESILNNISKLNDMISRSLFTCEDVLKEVLISYGYQVYINKLYSFEIYRNISDQFKDNFLIDKNKNQIMKSTKGRLAEKLDFYFDNDKRYLDWIFKKNKKLGVLISKLTLLIEILKLELKREVVKYGRQFN